MATDAAFIIARKAAMAAALLLSLPASAYAGPDKALPSFESLDRNTDERLSRSEASYDRQLADIFATSDLDGDGFVSRAEYASAVATSAATENLAKR